MTTGAQHAISLLTANQAGPGDRVVVEQPTYVHAIDTVRATGARPVPIPTGSDGLDLALRTGTIDVGDEVLTDLILDSPSPDSWSGDGRNPRVLDIGSMSKSHWGELRVGWLRGPAELVTRLALARCSTDLGTPVLDQLIATELLASTPGAVAGRVEQLRAGRDLLTRLLGERLSQWRFTVPRGGQCL